MQKFLTLSLIASCFTVNAVADVTEGLLEKGSTHSALFTMSPESGDLVGYAFKNQSAVGKVIFQKCQMENHFFGSGADVVQGYVPLTST